MRNWRFVLLGLVAGLVCGASISVSARPRTQPAFDQGPMILVQGLAAPNRPAFVRMNTTTGAAWLLVLDPAMNSGTWMLIRN